MEATFDLPTRLRHLEGFVVETAKGRLGTVEGFRPGGGSRSSAFMVVRAGRLGRRRMMVSVDDIAEIQARQQRIRLRSMWMTIAA